MTTRLLLAAATLVAMLALTGCGKEAGRVAFANAGANESPMTLAAGEVSFWTDIDVAYEGDATLEYTIDLQQSGASIGKVVCNPLGHMSVKTGWVEKNLGSSHSRSGNGKMDCKVTVAKAGPTTVKATLAFGQKPAKLTLSKADLVVKQ